MWGRETFPTAQKAIHHSSNSGLDLNRSVNVMDSKSFTSIEWDFERYIQKKKIKIKGHEIKPTRNSRVLFFFFFLLPLNNNNTTE
jgi:hypothetical protein